MWNVIDLVLSTSTMTKSSGNLLVWSWWRQPGCSFYPLVPWELCHCWSRYHSCHGFRSFCSSSQSTMFYCRVHSVGCWGLGAKLLGILCIGSFLWWSTYGCHLMKIMWTPSPAVRTCGHPIWWQNQQCLWTKLWLSGVTPGLNDLCCFPFENVQD